MIEGRLFIRGEELLISKCCGSEVDVGRYLRPLLDRAVRLEQHCDGSFRIVPLDRASVQVNASLLRVQHGEHVIERRPTTEKYFEEIVVCRVCGHPVGGM